MTVPYPSNLPEGGGNGYGRGCENAINLESDKKQNNREKIKEKLHECSQGDCNDRSCYLRNGRWKTARGNYAGHIAGHRQQHILTGFLAESDFPLKTK
jgi:hypothetical protein